MSTEREVTERELMLADDWLEHIEDFKSQVSGNGRRKLARLLSAIARETESLRAELASKEELIAELRGVMLRMDSVVEFASTREMESPSNHQEFAERARKNLRRWRIALEHSKPPAQPATEG